MTNTFKVKDNLLLSAAEGSDAFAPVPLTLSPNHGGRFKDLRYLLVHYTAGSSLEGTVKGFLDPSRKVSAHLVIGRDAAVAQLVPFDSIAWHAGESVWKGDSGKVKGLNQYSLGIELVNWGPLKRTSDGRFWSWSGKNIADSDVEEVDPSAPGSFGRRYWHRYPEEQIEALIGIARTLTWTYFLEDVLGHSDVSPGRKTDPGPAFPMNHLRALLQGRG